MDDYLILGLGNGAVQVVNMSNPDLVIDELFVSTFPIISIDVCKKDGK